MNSLKKMLPSLVVLMTFSTSVLAHPGHDHGHWSSSILHSILGVAVLLVVAAVVWKIRGQEKNL